MNLQQSCSTKPHRIWPHCKDMDKVHDYVLMKILWYMCLTSNRETEEFIKATHLEVTETGMIAVAIPSIELPLNITVHFTSCSEMQYLWLHQISKYSRSIQDTLHRGKYYVLWCLGISIFTVSSSQLGRPLQWQPSRRKSCRCKMWRVITHQIGNYHKQSYILSTYIGLHAQHDPVKSILYTL